MSDQGGGRLPSCGLLHLRPPLRTCPFSPRVFDCWPSRRSTTFYVQVLTKHHGWVVRIISTANKSPSATDRKDAQSSRLVLTQVFLGKALKEPRFPHWRVQEESSCCIHVGLLESLELCVQVSNQWSLTGIFFVGRGNMESS